MWPSQSWGPYGLKSAFAGQGLLANNHIGAWARHDQLIDLNVPLRLLVQPSKGQSKVLQITWSLGYQVKDCKATRILSSRIMDCHHQVALLVCVCGGSYPSAVVTVDIFYSPSWHSGNDYMHFFMYVFTNFSAWAGCDTRSNFKQSSTDLKLVGFFSRLIA